MKKNTIIGLFFTALILFVLYKILYPTTTAKVTSNTNSANTDEPVPTPMVTPTTITVTAPTLTSVPTNVVAGTPVIFTATNVTGTHQFFKNGVYLQTGTSLTIANPTANDVYTGKCISGGILSGVSGSITVNAVVVPTPSPPTTTPVSVSGGVLPAIFGNVPKETANDTFSPEKFAQNLTYPKTLNTDFNLQLPNWIFTLQTDLSKVYKQKGLNLQSLGFLGSVDYNVHCVEGTEWNYHHDPNTGQPWNNAFNTRFNVDLNTWKTSLPVERRITSSGLGWFNFAVPFPTMTDAEIIALADAATGSDDFGQTTVNGVRQEIYRNIDCESGLEDGHDTHRYLRLFKSMKPKWFGIYGFMYVHVVNSNLGYATNQGYPDTNGNLNMSDINPIFKTTEVLDGVSFKATDWHALAPILEISHYGETAFGIYNDGVRNLTPFGANKNIEHYLQRVVEICEKNAYAFKKLGGRDLVFVQAKLICDRGTTWQYPDNGSRPDGLPKTYLSGYLTRDQAFKSVLGVFFSACHGNEWNRPIPNLNSDCMNGFEGAKDLLATPYPFGNGVSISALDLRTGGFEFSLWFAQYKLDGESNWRQETGNDLAASQDNLLVRFLKKDNYIVVLVADPYNVARKKDNLQVKYGTFEKTFTLSDWRSCYSDNSTKDYIFGIFKIA